GAYRTRDRTDAQSRGSREGARDRFVHVVEEAEEIRTLGHAFGCGSVNQKVLPLPTSLSTPILPECASTTSRAIVSPSPQPPTLAHGTWKNFSKIRSRSSVGIPSPVSFTSKRTLPSEGSARRSIRPPVGVCRTAFTTRLESTSPTRFASARTLRSADGG